jgi:hypothetical protein
MREQLLEDQQIKAINAAAGIQANTLEPDP